MSVYGASATRDRQTWLFGLSGPQFFMVMAAGFPTWVAMAIGKWIALLALVPLWGVVGLLVCLPIRGWSAFQWIGVVLRHLTGTAFGWSRFQSKAAGGDLDLGDAASDEDNGEAGEADLLWRTDPMTLASVVYGKRPIEDAEAAGELALTGDRALARRFVDLFELPAKAGLP